MTPQVARIGVLATSDGILAGRFVEALLAAGCHIDALLLDAKPTSVRDTAIHADRTGDALLPIPLHTFEARAIPAYLVSSHNAEACIALVHRLELDWLVNAGTPRLLSAEALAAPRCGVLNCHPGLLPAFRGASAVEWAIYLNEPVGNTVHLMSPVVDEGPILMQRAIEVATGASYRDVRIATYTHGFALMAEAVHAIQAGVRTLSDFRAQGRGRTFRPIDPSRLAAAKRRLAERRYDGTIPLGDTPMPEPEAT